MLWKITVISLVVIIVTLIISILIVSSTQSKKKSNECIQTPFPTIELSPIKEKNQFVELNKKKESIQTDVNKTVETKCYLTRRSKITSSNFGIDQNENFGAWFAQTHDILLVSCKTEMLLLNKKSTLPFNQVAKFRNKTPCDLVYNCNQYHWYFLDSKNKTLFLQVTSGKVYVVATEVEHYAMDGNDSFVILRNNKILNYQKLASVDGNKIHIENLKEIEIPQEFNDCYGIYINKQYTFLCFANGQQVVYKNDVEVFRTNSFLRVENVIWSPQFEFFSIQYEHKVDTHKIVDGVRIDQQVFKDDIVGSIEYLDSSHIVVGLPSRNEGSGAIAIYELGYSWYIIADGELNSYLGACRIHASGSSPNFTLLCTTENDFMDEIEIKF